MKKLLFSCSLLVLNFFAPAQEWVELMQQPNANLYHIQNSFENYWQGKDNTEKGKGYKPFKRWENFAEPRVYPSGNISQLNLTSKNYQEFYNDYITNNPTGKLLSSSQIASATWTAIGPMGAISGSAGGQLLKSGRINFITVHPTNTLTLFIGAPAGGLWKSTNGGTSWTTNTDNLTVTGCSDLAIDPLNTNIMYLAMGDGDGGDTRSTGILKSTDGGNTWAATGLVNAVTNNFLIRRLIINPVNPQIVIAATNAGIYRTINGGTNWSQAATGSCFDLEFKPGNPNTVYAAGASFRISQNGGATWSIVSSGIPTTGVNRMAIAVTPADPNYVYVLASASSNNGLQGFYRSTASGTVFSQMTTTLNLLGWSSTGSDTGGQGWYDLCIACSPLNKDEVVTGGVNVWRTTTGGASWALYGHWTGSGAPFTHADHHDLEYAPNGTLFNANDGTVYRRAATSWTEISGNINISQIYKLGTSALTANKWITGHQDNGTSIWNGTSYNAALGGDGMDCFIDRTNDNNMFGEYYNGAFRKSTNGGVSWATCTSGLSGTAPWVTTWKQDPSVATTLYAGRTNMFKSTNSGTSWAQAGTISGAGTIREFAIAPSNNQIIYVLKTSGIFKTINGGASWTSVTGTVPVGSAAPDGIIIDPADPNNAWVVLSGYSAANKVFMTTNGGTSWTNFTSNLPNIPGNCLVYQPGTNDRIYVGMDVGVYYRDNTSTTWTLYNAGLPNTPVMDMEISPADPTKIVAATYGRGTWKVDVVNSAAAPASAFSYSPGICTGAAKTFNDISTNGPTSWSWSVTPATGVIITTPTSQNPSFVFSTAGTYTVSMTASNGFGPGNVSSQTVSVTATPTVTITNSVQTICSGSSANITASGATTYTWNTGATGASIVVSPLSTAIYTVTGINGSCSAKKNATITVNTTPIVSVNSSSICVGSQATLTASGASTYSWTTGSSAASIVVSPALTTVYTVTGTTLGCKNIKTSTVTVNSTPNISITNTMQSICSGNSANISVSGASTYSWSTGSTSSAITISPLATTVYTVRGYNGGCASTVKSATVVVNPSPTVTVNNSVICEGSSANLTANGAGSYLWNTGAVTNNISVSPALTTVYTVTGTTSGCTNTKNATVTVNPLPVINVSANNTIVCQGQMVSLSATGANTYTWQPGNVSGSVANFIPAASQAYTCAGTASNGCNGSNSIFITVSSCAGLLMNGSEPVLFNLYPNPAKDLIRMNIVSGKHFECSVEIIDVTGKLVLQQQAKFENANTEQSFNISTFANGIYFMKITSKEGSIKTIKIVKV